MPPVHPGEILKEMYLDPLKISVTALADNLGVARKTVSQLVNGHMGVSAEMALRLGKAFNTTPELWLNMQRNYDLWQHLVAFQQIADGRPVPIAAAGRSDTSPV